MAMGIWRMRSAVKIIAPVRIGTIVTSASPPDVWSAVICRASSATRAAIRSCGIRTRSMSRSIAGA